MEDRAISTSGRGGRRRENGMSASRNIWLPTEGEKGKECRGTEGVEWSNKGSTSRTLSDRASRELIPTYLRGCKEGGYLLV